MEVAENPVIVVGAGMGGLAAAIRLAAAGMPVTVVETAEGPGGKMRTVPSVAGPVDAGPTVLTMRAVFDALFALGGERLEDHLTLLPQPILARHWWADGSVLDLHADSEATLEAIRVFAGAREAEAFRRFDALSARLFKTFDGPVMQRERPDIGGILRATLREPRLWPALMPGRSLTGLLRRYFRDERLVQLFGRYATYVGGRPGKSPGVLSLIWRAEAAGVWAVAGGMHGLALALAGLAERLGVRFRYGVRAERIVVSIGQVSGVEIVGGQVLECRACVFNGDPAALSAGLLGDAARSALPASATRPRSLSAWVWSFAAVPRGAIAGNLIHHNVFFSSDPAAEFRPIGKGKMPEIPTLYLCAEDRAAGAPARPEERFEIIVNGPADHAATLEEFQQCSARTFPPLRRLGLSFDPEPRPEALTTPRMLDRLFPGSGGAIYGRSPEGVLAAFRRAGALTGLAGLYLAGGGVHPGAGVPMAALSGRHAAEAILRGRTSASTSPRTDTPGGISTGSPTTGRAPYR